MYILQLHTTTSHKAELQTPLGVKLEAGTLLLIAEKKKSSISGEAKNAIGDLLFLDDEHDVTLLFLGAGGHVSTSGILNLLPFGVEQTLEHISSSLRSSPFISLVAEEVGVVAS